MRCWQSWTPGYGRAVFPTLGSLGKRDMETREQKRLQDELQRWSETCRSIGDTKTADLIVRALVVLNQKRISPRIATELTACAADYDEKPHKTYLVGLLRQTAAILSSK